MNRNFFVLALFCADLSHASHGGVITDTPSPTPTPTLTASPTPPAPANDNRIDAIPIGEGVYSGDSTWGTKDGFMLCSSSHDAPDVWYRYSASAAGCATFSLCGSSYDTMLSVHSSCARDEFACNDDVTECGNSSTIRLVVETGTEYWVRVSGWRTSKGAFTLAITLAEAPCPTLTPTPSPTATLSCTPIAAPYPYEPSPANGAVNVPLYVPLYFYSSSGYDDLTLWFGESPETMAVICSDTGCNRTVGPLKQGTTYFWQAYVHNSHGESCYEIGGNTGERWSFTTATFPGDTPSPTPTASPSPTSTPILTSTPTPTASPTPALIGVIQTYAGHTGSVATVAFSPDGTKILTASFDSTARVWDRVTGAPLRTFSGHGSSVVSAAYSPDGNSLLTGSSDKTAKLWNADTEELIRTFSGHVSGVIQVLFMPGGNEILTTSSDRTINRWDIATGAVIGIYSDCNSSTRAAISPDGASIMTNLITVNYAARLWDTATEQVKQVYIGHSSYVQVVDFSQDGTKVLTGSSDKTARLWDKETGATLQVFTGHSNSVGALDISPDDSRILTGSEDRTAKIWDISTAKIIHSFDPYTRVNSVAFSPDGAEILTGLNDNTAKLWSTSFRYLGDMDNSGCTSLSDFLFLLDRWDTDFNGAQVGLNDFLKLLDNWQQGPSCP